MSKALLYKDTSPCRTCDNINKNKNSIAEFESTLHSFPHLSLMDAIYNGRRFKHKWKCSKHNRTYQTTLLSIIKQKGNIRCCGRDSMRGINHPRFNASVSDEYRNKRIDRIELSVWSKSIKNRDNWKCYMCASSNKLEAHHLDSYLAYKSSRFDINNGITLCKVCHMDFHKLYGYKITTKHQFIEYCNNKNVLFNITDNSL